MCDGVGKVRSQVTLPHQQSPLPPQPWARIRSVHLLVKRYLLGTLGYPCGERLSLLLILNNHKGVSSVLMASPWLLTKEWLAGDERDGIPPAAPSVSGLTTNANRPFQMTQTQPAPLRSGGPKPGLPAGRGRRRAVLECWLCVASLVPPPGGSFPSLFQCLQQVDPTSVRCDLKLLSAVLSQTLQPGAQRPETAGLPRWEKAGMWWERNQALYIQDLIKPEGWARIPTHPRLDLTPLV